MFLLIEKGKTARKADRPPAEQFETLREALCAGVNWREVDSEEIAWSDEVLIEYFTSLNFDHKIDRLIVDVVTFKVIG